jgi:hypothetical protein
VIRAVLMLLLLTGCAQLFPRESPEVSARSLGAWCAIQAAKLAYAVPTDRPALAEAITVAGHRERIGVHISGTRVQCDALVAA